MTRALGCAVALLMAATTTALAQGSAAKPVVAKKQTPKIITTIDLAEVVRRSPFIFRARVTKTAHTYGRSRRTGEKYTRNHRVEVEVVKSYRGGKDIDAYRTKRPRERILLHRRVPVPWAKLVDYYYSGYDLADAQVGDEFIAFMRWTTPAQVRDGADVLLVEWVESLTHEGHLAQLIAAGEDADDAKRRKRAACPKPRTFFYANDCLTVAQLYTRVKCPKGSKLSALPQEPLPRAYCALPDGTLHGPFYTWRRDGDIASRGEHDNGKRSGTWTDYARRGKKTFRREYTDGKIHGRVAYYYDNGEISQMGYVAAGKREGTWKQFDKKGKLLGTYEMAGGTGTEKSYHAKGKVDTATDFRAGFRHGRHRGWHPNGNKAVVGAYAQDKPAGLWKYFNGKGQFVRGECYSKGGGLRWETPVEKQADAKSCTANADR